MSPQRHTLPKVFKAQVLEEGPQSGASVAGVALSHGLTANLMHKWIRKQREPLPVVPAGCVPVPLGFLPTGHADSAGLTIRIESPCHTGSLSVHWPVQAPSA